MAKKSAGSDSVYKIVEVIGTSPTSWEEAGKRAVQSASKTLRDLRIAEVVKQDMAIENGKVVAYRTRMLLSFKYQA
jgi:flavin-binding protein dodecin